jgi:inner membrane transporter RhtA
MYALRRLTTAAFGTLMCLEPALALIAGFGLLGQVPRAWSLTGIAFVVAAGLGAVRTGARRSQAPRRRAEDTAQNAGQVTGATPVRLVSRNP